MVSHCLVIGSYNTFTMSKKTLTEEQKHRLSHWFSKVDDNTIELKERRWGGSKTYTNCLFISIL